MSKTAHLPFRLQPFASVGVQNIWGHKWGHFANLKTIMIINSIIYGEISNPTLSATKPGSALAGSGFVLRGCGGRTQWIRAGAQAEATVAERKAIPPSPPEIHPEPCANHAVRPASSLQEEPDGRCFPAHSLHGGVR